MLQIFKNDVLFSALIGWFGAQFLKIVYIYVRYKKLDLLRFFGSGGMPSSHSAFVTALTFGVGEKVGYDSVEFAISFVLSFIVMYDAAGVRRAAGLQAAAINKIISQLSHFDFNIEKQLKELLGHTPIEVIAGAILGTIIGILYV